MSKRSPAAYVYGNGPHCPPCTRRDYAEGVLVTPGEDTPRIDANGVPYHAEADEGLIVAIYSPAATIASLICQACATAIHFERVP